jgi:hypothetical protein
MQIFGVKHNILLSGREPAPVTSFRQKIRKKANVRLLPQPFSRCEWNGVGQRFAARHIAARDGSRRRCALRGRCVEDRLRRRAGRSGAGGF